MGNLILCHDKHATHPYEITESTAGYLYNRRIVLLSV